MSNEIKLTQEKWNMVLDLRDKVTILEKSLKETRVHLRNEQLKTQELEKKILMNNTNVNFNDIFRSK
jgi:hypothetical protein